jgi:hypothetical protein
VKPDASLVAYLNDHLAGASAALVLLERFVDRHAGSELETFFRDLSRDVQEDQHTLRDLCQHVGAVSRTRRAAGWLAGEVSRLKLTAFTDSRASFALFEGLEMLELGILGKRGLWRALRILAPIDVRLSRWDFAALEARADEQAERVERLRRAVVLAALRPEASVAGPHQSPSSSEP